MSSVILAVSFPAPLALEQTVRSLNPSARCREYAFCTGCGAKNERFGLRHHDTIQTRVYITDVRASGRTQRREGNPPASRRRLIAPRSNTCETKKR